MTSNRIPLPHGGPRPQPAHFEAEHVPPEVSAYGTEGGALRVGSPGKVGVLDLRFELRGQSGHQRTELVRHFQKAPLQIMRPLYYDEARPDMPYTYLMTTGGGVLHGDRQRTDLGFGRGTAAHVTTQAHTKLYRMEHGYATALLSIEAAEDSYVEYLPDPVIPYAGARFYQRTHVTLDPTATLVLGDTLYAGRLSRGERNGYEVYATDLTIERPDRVPIVVERAQLVPRGGRIGGLGVLDDHDIVSTLYVVSPLAPANVIADRLHDALLDAATGTRFGVSRLPANHGAWLRMLGDDPVEVSVANRTAWQAIRKLLTGCSAPQVRK